MQDEYAANANADQTDQRIEINCPTAMSALYRDCVRQEIEAEQDSNRANRDLNAQEEMAKYTLVMGYTALFGLILGIGSVYLIWATLKATQDMAVDQRNIGQAQSRAWLGIDTINAIAPDDRKTNITIKNFGQTPAINYTVEIKNDIQESDFESFTPSRIGAKGFFDPQDFRPMQVKCTENILICFSFSDVFGNEITRTYLLKKRITPEPSGNIQYFVFNSHQKVRSKQ